MYEYVLIFSKYLKDTNIQSYDIVFYNNQFYAGNDLFKNFTYYLGKAWYNPVKRLFSYEQAEQHFLEIC
jgi:hypothetical protein